MSRIRLGSVSVREGNEMSGNPFVPVEAPAPPEEVEIPDVVFGEQEILDGPASPAVAPPVSGEVPSWPLVEMPTLPGLMVMGLHGGSGANLVSALLARTEQGEQLWSAYDVGTAWPVSEGWTRPRAPLNVLAVYRPHRAGVNAAERFARAWASDALPDSRLLGILAVDDGPKLLETQKSAIARIARMTPHGWHVPWQEEWRISEPDFGAIPRRIRKTLRSIRKTVKEEGVPHD